MNDKEYKEKDACNNESSLENAEAASLEDADAEDVLFLEEEAEDSERYLVETQRAILTTGNPFIPMFMLNRNMVIVYCSDAARELLGDYYDIAEKPFFNVFSTSPSRDIFPDIIAELNSDKNGHSWCGLLAHKTDGMRTIYTNVTFLPLFNIDGNGNVDFYVVFFEKSKNGLFEDAWKVTASLIKAVELKDNDTGMHNVRVSSYSQLLAQKIYEKRLYPQVDVDFVDNISLFAAAHDIGKIGTPDSILLKPGKLSASEWDIMKEHTINGAFILSGFPVPMAKEIALAHHEGWDGSGYPYKLAGEMIPLPARIVALADVYDALRMRRTYKEGFAHPQSVKIIMEYSGTHFDPVIAGIFESVADEFDHIWETHSDEGDAVLSVAEVQNAARNAMLKSLAEGRGEPISDSLVQHLGDSAI